MERENQPSARGWRRRRSAVGRWSAGRLGAVFKLLAVKIRLSVIFSLCIWKLPTARSTSCWGFTAWVDAAAFLGSLFSCVGGQLYFFILCLAIWPQSGNHRPIEENFQEFLVVRAELLPFLCFPWCDYTMFCRFADNITLLGMIVASLAG
nr:uncharacterized protein LOC127308561 isoform X1 [Lolium perenne]